MTIASLLRESSEKLSTISDTPLLDAQVLLADIIHKDRAWLVAHQDDKVSEQDHQQYQIKLDRLHQGIPLPYVLGRWEFFGLRFLVTPDVLIPRPETELLVEIALDWLGKRTSPTKIVDIGTGSGCIAVSIAFNHPGGQIIATDPSMASLQVARENIHRHALNQQINLIQTDLLDGIDTKFDLVCANLPYIPSSTLKKLDIYCKEPTRALDGGKDGLEVIERCLRVLPYHLNENGMALFEIEARQGTMSVEIARRVFPEAKIQIEKDLAGKDRLLTIERSS